MPCRSPPTLRVTIATKQPPASASVLPFPRLVVRPERGKERERAGRGGRGVLEVFSLSSLSLSLSLSLSSVACDRAGVLCSGYRSTWRNLGTASNDDDETFRRQAWETSALPGAVCTTSARRSRGTHAGDRHALNQGSKGRTWTYSVWALSPKNLQASLPPTHTSHRRSRGSIWRSVWRSRKDGWEDCPETGPARECSARHGRSSRSRRLQRYDDQRGDGSGRPAFRFRSDDCEYYRE